MLSESRCRALFEVVTKASDADETEVHISSSRQALTRFANNTIHQNVEDEGVSLSVRTVYGGRTARATTNKLDPDSILRCVRECAALARSSPAEADLQPMPGPQVYAGVSRWWEATAATGPSERAAGVRTMIAEAERAGLTAAGILATGESYQCLMNSRGLFASYHDTNSEASVTMMGPTSSGWAKANSLDIRNLDVQELAARAARKAVESANPVEVAAGRYTVILEPSAALDVLGWMYYDFGGLSVAEKRSFLTERVGKKLFGENITIRDDVGHPLQSGAPFDGEGIPRQSLALVENGVVRNLVYAQKSAKLAGAAPTGHGFPLPTEMGEAPMNIVVEGGTTSLEEMIASTERGILVTRLWYIREVEPYEKVMTGMTRDGTFLVEGGKVTRGLRNFRFNESLVEMLSNVESLGPSVRAAGEEAFEMVVPAMKVRDFHFSEVTKF
jgi:predicted Zn-dependent protease